MKIKLKERKSFSLHSWSRKVRDCPNDRIIINPFIGCSFNCFYCYANAFPFPLFLDFKNKKEITAFTNLPQLIEKKILRQKTIPSFYLSTVADPFNIAEKQTYLTIKILKIVAKYQLSIDFLTKATPFQLGKEYSQLFFNIVKKIPDFYLQISLPSLISQQIIHPWQNLNNIKEFIHQTQTLGHQVIIRLDPIIPFINDSQEDLEAIAKFSRENKIKHIVTSCLDIPTTIKHKIFNWIKEKKGEKIASKFQNLYQTSTISYYLEAEENYRKKLFQKIIDIFQRKNNIKVGFCNEFLGTVPRSFNQIFRTKFCEGRSFPLFRRIGDRFVPLECPFSFNCRTCRYYNHKNWSCSLNP